MQGVRVHELPQAPFAPVHAFHDLGKVLECPVRSGHGCPELHRRERIRNLRYVGHHIRQIRVVRFDRSTDGIDVVHDAPQGFPVFRHHRVELGARGFERFHRPLNALECCGQPQRGIGLEHRFEILQDVIHPIDELVCFVFQRHELHTNRFCNADFNVADEGVARLRQDRGFARNQLDGFCTEEVVRSDFGPCVLRHPQVLLHQIKRHNQRAIPFRRERNVCHLSHFESVDQHWI